MDYNLLQHGDGDWRNMRLNIPHLEEWSGSEPWLDIGLNQAHFMDIEKKEETTDFNLSRDSTQGNTGICQNLEQSLKWTGFAPVEEETSHDSKGAPQPTPALGSTWVDLERTGPSSQRDRGKSRPGLRTSFRKIRPPSLSPPSSGGEDSGVSFSFEPSVLSGLDTHQRRGRLLSISEEVVTSTPRLTPTPFPPLLDPNRDETPRTASPESSLELKDSDGSQDSNPRFKTEICRNFKEKGSCMYGPECQFAHGHEEMRDSGKQNRYKTKLCQKYWIAGYCAYGPRCNFLHNEDGDTPPRKKNSSGDTTGESLEWTSPSLSPTAAAGQIRIPPLASLLWPKYGSGRLASFQNKDCLSWVDTWTNRIV